MVPPGATNFIFDANSRHGSKTYQNGRTQQDNITTNSLSASPTRFVYSKTPAACLDSPLIGWLKVT